MSLKSDFCSLLILFTVLVWSCSASPISSSLQSVDICRLYPKDFGKSREFKAQFADRDILYEMMEPSKDICHMNGDVKVLVMITSGPGNFDKRKAMRESWVYDKSNPSRYLILFFIGQAANAATNAAILEEQHQYGDIVRYSAVEEYNMLSLKTHAALTWKREFCPTADYMLKTDDDSVIFLERFDHFVNTDFDKTVEKHESAIFCNLYKTFKPIRYKTSKYYVSKDEYDGNAYPNFCQGSSYLVNSQAVSALLDHAKHAKFLRLEDVLFTGIVASDANVYRHGSKVFGYQWKKQGQPTRDADHVPYLSAGVGLPASKLGKFYQQLKELDPDSWLTRVHYDYHGRLVAFLNF